MCREAPGGRKLNHSPGSLEFIAQDSQDVAELSVAIASLVLGGAGEIPISLGDHMCL